MNQPIQFPDRTKPPILIMHFRLTRAQVEEKRALAILDGFNVLGDEGEATYYGARIRYMYSDHTQILSLSLMEKGGLSRFKTNAAIQSQAEEWFGVKSNA